MEEPTVPDVEELLGALWPQNQHGAKLEAARRLGEVAISSVSIVSALLTAKQSDPSYQVRRAAAGSLQAPVHQGVLRGRPEMMAAAATQAPVRVGAPSGRAMTGAPSSITRRWPDAGRLSVGEWVVTLLVLSIPLVNLVMCVVWAFWLVDREDRANFCRASLVVGVIGFALGMVLGGLSV